MELVGALICGEHLIGALHLVPGAADDEAGRFIHAERVAGELLEDEAIERLVFVERADDVVAIRPRVPARGVGFEAVRFREADDVEPMARPTFSLLRRGEQPFDQPPIGVIGRVRLVDERSDFLRNRRQAHDIEIDATDQRPPIGRG